MAFSLTYLIYAPYLLLDNSRTERLIDDIAISAGFARLV
jgi:hypothetical protein